MSYLNEGYVNEIYSLYEFDPYASSYTADDAPEGWYVTSTQSENGWIATLYNTEQGSYSNGSAFDHPGNAALALVQEYNAVFGG